MAFGTNRRRAAFWATVVTLFLLVTYSSAAPISDHLFKPCQNNDQCPDLTCKAGYCHDLCDILNPCYSSELPRCVTVNHRPICVSKKDDTGSSQQLGDDVEATEADQQREAAATTATPPGTGKTRREEAADERKSTDASGEGPTSTPWGTTPSFSPDKGATMPTRQPGEQPDKNAGGTSLNKGEIAAAAAVTLVVLAGLVLLAGWLGYRACIDVQQRQEDAATSCNGEEDHELKEQLNHGLEVFNSEQFQPSETDQTII